jgi:tetratricopeptide (TPR) repeat protein
MTKLVRYNLRIVLSNNWWLLVFPIAVSQLTVFWTIITRKFAPQLPADSAELVTPLLAAFLTAHVMTAEYQSRVGAILASKPLNLGKVVLMRVSAVLVLVWLLELASLAAYYFGMEPYGMLAPFLASIPSTLFLSMLALTFATLFRNALAGFGIAALYWCFDLPSGPPANHFLSLRSYATFLSSSGPQLDALVTPWWIAKVVLLAGAVALYLYHGRLVFRLGIVPPMRARRRSLGWAAALVAIYVVSGACMKVGYGYSQRGRLQPNDGTWFRQQFAAYGPIPVASVFGPAFSRYLGDTNGWRPAADEADMLGDTLKHHRGLREVVDRMPDSLWAPSAAELLGRLSSRQGTTVDERVSVFQKVADRYPNSPYVDVSLREKARIYDGAEMQERARDEYEKMVALRPASVFRNEALHYIVNVDAGKGDYSSVAKWAKMWTNSAPIQEKFSAYLALAEALKSRNDTAGAKDAAKRAVDAARAYDEARRNDRVPGTASSYLKWDRESRQAAGKAKAML